MADHGNFLPMNSKAMAWTVAFLTATGFSSQAEERAKPWQVGTPIVTYWAGPEMTDKTALQMAEGGWNLVWCRELELDVAAPIRDFSYCFPIELRILFFHGHQS